MHYSKVREKQVVTCLASVKLSKEFHEKLSKEFHESGL